MTFSLTPTANRGNVIITWLLACVILTDYQILLLCEQEQEIELTKTD